jgi:hypothetical protein
LLVILLFLTNTILKRFVTDSKDYPLQTTPKILGTTMLMTAVAMMGNYIRSGGKNWEEQEPGELVYEGIRRWGGVGFWEYADRLQTNVDLGGGQGCKFIKIICWSFRSRCYRYVNL